MKRLNWVIKHRGDYYRKWVKLHLTNCYTDRNRTLPRTLWPPIPANAIAPPIITQWDIAETILCLPSDLISGLSPPFNKFWVFWFGPGVISDRTDTSFSSSYWKVS
jgi:hypothetical protein